MNVDPCSNVHNFIWHLAILVMVLSLIPVPNIYHVVHIANLYLTLHIDVRFPSCQSTFTAQGHLFNYPFHTKRADPTSNTARFDMSLSWGGYFSYENSRLILISHFSGPNSIFYSNAINLEMGNGMWAFEILIPTSYFPSLTSHIKFSTSHIHSFHSILQMFGLHDINSSSY